VYGDLKVSVADNIGFVFERAPLLSFATTAVVPHVNDLAGCMPGSAILHISLRDLAPEIILRSDNVVDDINHVCRADTSLHLAEQKTKDRGFIRCTLADITLGRVPTRTSAEKHTIFSPFGLGVLDLAVSKFILELAQVHNRGVVLESFLPGPWTKR
jgi:N-[(2S)-2-amino-2-carboxyethyl]-L-glutamate dehydrogenase